MDQLSLTYIESGFHPTHLKSRLFYKLIIQRQAAFLSDLSYPKMSSWTWRYFSTFSTATKEVLLDCWIAKWSWACNLDGWRQLSWKHFPCMQKRPDIEVQVGCWSSTSFYIRSFMLCSFMPFPVTMKPVQPQCVKVLDQRTSKSLRN